MVNGVTAFHTPLRRGLGGDCTVDERGKSRGWSAVFVVLLVGRGEGSKTSGIVRFAEIERLDEGPSGVGPLVAAGGEQFKTGLREQADLVEGVGEHLGGVAKLDR